MIVEKCKTNPSHDKPWGDGVFLFVRVCLIAPSGSLAVHLGNISLSLLVPILVLTILFDYPILITNILCPKGHPNKEIQRYTDKIFAMEWQVLSHWCIWYKWLLNRTIAERNQIVTVQPWAPLDISIYINTFPWRMHMPERVSISFFNSIILIFENTLVLMSIKALLFK